MLRMGQYLFYIGIALVAVAVLLGIVSICVLKMRYSRLHAQLKKEYGPKQSGQSHMSTDQKR